VSDEAGSHHLYWTDPRVISGDDPVPMGSNNSGRGVGGSMVHYAGYTPHPALRPPRRRGAVPNLYITDGSVLPTQGSANPALTIMAVAARAAEQLIAGAN
jgi:hypothetical protein